MPDKRFLTQLRIAPVQTGLLVLLRLYKLAISPYVGWHCRFYPSCSEYAREAIQQHGAAYGSYLTLHRLCRCHPFAAGGVDCVPGTGSGTAQPDERVGTGQADSSSPVQQPGPARITLPRP